jgi:hypothetical protein
MYGHVTLVHVIWLPIINFRRQTSFYHILQLIYRKMELSWFIVYLFPWIIYTLTLTVFTLFFFWISSSLDLSITEETWVVEMCIWCIKICNVLVLHFNPWFEATTGGLLIPDGPHSPVGKYFGTWFKIRIWIELSRK